MRTRSWIAAVLAVAGGLAPTACNAGVDLSTPPECNPLGGVGCVTPWPSSIYEVGDASTHTGRRLDIPQGALPSNQDGVPIDPSQFSWRDGWSPAGFLFTAFPGGVDPSNLPSHGDFAVSLTDASPTVLVDMATGERVAHFAEVDVNAGDDLDHQALYIRPANRLRPGARYAAAVRRSLTDPDGAALAVPPGFAAIVSGEATGHARLEAVRGRYDAVFAALEAAGVSRDDLVVAWDFTVASDESITRTLRQARDAAMPVMGDGAANLRWTVDQDGPFGDGTQIARRVLGTFEVPSVLTDGASNRARVARDANGDVVVTGMYEAPFAAMVPECAAREAPVPIVLFGHSLFGDLGEVQGRYMRQIAQQLCVVVLATEWRGMSTQDIAAAALALNEASQLSAFGERIVQGMLSHLALAQLARGSMAADLLVDGEGAPVADASRIYYYGVSQGHVLGATYLAYEPTIRRAVLAVGGGNWSLAFERSSNWPTYRTIIEGAYGGPLEIVLIEALAQLAYDPTENLHVSRHLVDDPLPGASPKQLLIQMAVGDSQVTNLSTAQQAREIGVPVLGPALSVPWGLREDTGPLSSALVIFDQKLEPRPPETNLAFDIDNTTHRQLRYEPAVIRQIEEFWDTGRIIHTCAGSCDCSAGSCD